jgi:hypothetical protein
MNVLKTNFKQEIESRCKDSSAGVRMNFFELLHTPYGFESLQSWFCSQSGSEIDEYGLCKILKQICENTSETYSWEIFDTLAQDLTISFKEFVMLVFLFAAFETGQLKLMLYMHGRRFYQILSGGDKQEICFERIKRLGRILRMNENYLIDKGRELNMSGLRTPLGFEHFELFYFKVFSEIDAEKPTFEAQKEEIKEEIREEVKFEPNPVLPPPPVVVQSKKKSSCTGCNSKACVLL